MTKGTKTVLIIAIICIALSVLLFGVGAMLGGTRLSEGVDTEIFGINVHMGKDGVYTEGTADLESTGYETTAEFTEEIDAIEVNWTSGEIKFEFGGENITVRESSDRIIDDENVMVCSIENGTLKIHYHAPRVNIVSFGGDNKDLTVTIPESLAGNIKHIDIDSTSADITIGGFELDGLSISSTSGSAFVTELSAGDFVFGATSGDLTLENCSFGFFSAQTTSGCMYVTDVSAGYAGFDGTSGDVIAKNCSFGKAEAESTSGNISMSLNSVPSEFDADTTSGDVELFLPENAEFELEFDRTSGELELDFAAVKHGDEYTVGNGRNEINIETTSGDAYIKVK